MRSLLDYANIETIGTAFAAYCGGCGANCRIPEKTLPIAALDFLIPMSDIAVRKHFRGCDENVPKRNHDGITFAPNDSRWINPRIMPSR